ncbi:hypothetical protein E1301_Tti022221 [Triplophysa tibetana]|uniref:Uncharacterized protein n=1 Tax=Triplophysa tibetana TaxID=1572043 RepID=A0A5A9NNG4_9TELE|nr:hypothetical protein E1301_Tti022221 [Triplophysa tibetana]
MTNFRSATELEIKNDISGHFKQAPGTAGGSGSLRGLLSPFSRFVGAYPMGKGAPQPAVLLQTVTTEDDPRKHIAYRGVPPADRDSRKGLSYFMYSPVTSYRGECFFLYCFMCEDASSNGYNVNKHATHVNDDVGLTIVYVSRPTRVVCSFEVFRSPMSPPLFLLRIAPNF